MIGSGVAINENRRASAAVDRSNAIGHLFERAGLLHSAELAIGIRTGAIGAIVDELLAVDILVGAISGVLRRRVAIGVGAIGVDGQSVEIIGAGSGIQCAGRYDVGGGGACGERRRRASKRSRSVGGSDGERYDVGVGGRRSSSGGSQSVGVDVELLLHKLSLQSLEHQILAAVLQQLLFQMLRRMQVLARRVFPLTFALQSKVSNSIVSHCVGVEHSPNSHTSLFFAF